VPAHHPIPPYVPASPTTFLLFNTSDIGGSERRLAGLWLYLRDSLGDSFRLVCHPGLVDALARQKEYAAIDQYRHQIISVPFTGRTREDTTLSRAFAFSSHVKAGDQLHFQGFFPLLSALRKDIFYLYSLNESSLNNVNLTGKAYYLLSLLRAQRADILDPKLHALFQRLYFFSRSKFYLTSGSYVDTTLFQPRFPKRNDVVFLGRFIAVKQVIPFVKAMPLIHQRLVAAGITDARFYLLGFGALEAEMRALLAGPAYEGIEWILEKAANPEAYLRSSKIILSIQRGNNYPSKSLLEGMAAGNVPVVTDAGTTELIAPRAFSTYVPETFSDEEIAEAITGVLTLGDAAFAARSEQARTFVERAFTLKRMADYYKAFYGVGNGAQ
jgi:glycosyltransferase involved in cell wall biosynthesis